MRHRHDLDARLLVSLVLGVAACNSDAAGDTDTDAGTETGASADDSPTAADTGDTTDPDPTTTATSADTGEPSAPELAAVWTVANPSALVEDRLIRLTPALNGAVPRLKISVDVVSIQSIAINADDDAAITYDAPGGLGGVILDDGLADDPDDRALGLGDRVIVGPATGLTAPRGLEFVGEDGLLLVADVGAAAILAFTTADDGDVAPVFTISDLGSSKAVWDVHFDDDEDVLYAAGTNGEVQVFEDFTDERGAGGPDRTIVPTVDGVKISVNLHGISRIGDTLYLSDVGSPMDATDGQLFVIRDADDADGEVDVDQRIAGGALGNPVDLELRGGLLGEALYVAEKSNSQLLIYTSALLGGDLEYAGSVAVSNPESVALTAAGPLILARNPAGLDFDAARMLDLEAIDGPEFTATLDRLGGFASLQSLVLSAEGDAFVGFDGARGDGGVFAVSGLVATSKSPVDAVKTRIAGPRTGIVGPKGLALNAAADRLFVADVGAGDLKVFAADATGDAAPLFVVTELGGGPVWDIAYVDGDDRLFAAGTDGSVRVFDGFLVGEGSGGPDRVFVPTRAGAPVGVNLHGIHYDAASDTLLVSDVGDTMSDADGFVYIIADAGAADGEVDVQAMIGGAGTGLGNPVDLAFAGDDLYVAEKAKSRVLRYDGVLGLRGLVDAAPDAAIAVDSAESVQLHFE